MKKRSFQADSRTGAVSLALVVGVMLTAFLESLDTTVVNVALPHMMGALGATPDQITWMITAYLVPTAIIMPLTGYLVNQFGRKRVLLVGIAGFVFSSAACGFAWDLTSIVTFRFFQGGFGAVLVPISQAVVLESFPREKRDRAMSVWGIAMMSGPILGPVVGGWITENWDWRAIFFINIPIGLIALLLCFGTIEGSSTRKKIQTDWQGLILLSIFLASLQMFLDQGHTRDWFESGVIWSLAWVACASFALFLVHSLNVKSSIIDLSLFADRNFAVGNLLMAGYGFAMYSTIVMWPLFAQEVMGYPADTAGWVLAPRGLVCAVVMYVVGSWLAPRVDNRVLIFLGFFLSVLASMMMTQLSLEIDMSGLIFPGLVFGVAIGCVFSQLSVAVFETIPTEKSEEAAGLYNVMRTMGGAIGISVTSTLLVRREQVNWNYLVVEISDTNPRLYDWLANSPETFSGSWGLPTLFGEFMRQVQVKAFNEVFFFLALVFAALTPMTFLLKKTTRDKSTT